MDTVKKITEISRAHELRTFGSICSRCFYICASRSRKGVPRAHPALPQKQVSSKHSGHTKAHSTWQNSCPSAKREVAAHQLPFNSEAMHIPVSFTPGSQALLWTPSLKSSIQYWLHGQNPKPAQKPAHQQETSTHAQAWAMSTNQTINPQREGAMGIGVRASTDRQPIHRKATAAFLGEDLHKNNSFVPKESLACYTPSLHSSLKL